VSASIEELERRLRLLEDERELRTLLARYSFNADLGRSREYTELYTEDGAIDLGPQPAGVNRTGPVRYEGHEDILLKFITGRAHRSIEGDSQHHTLGPLVINVEGDDATGEGYSFVLVRHPEGVLVHTANFNRWTFRRVDGEWKIAERVVRAIGSDQIHDVITRTTH
jgi:hypothetical protein